MAMAATRTVISETDALQGKGLPKDSNPVKAEV